MEIKRKMSEMKNADVRYISLVKRAANRMPFRVVKSDKEHQMGIDLSSLGRIIKKADKNPIVAGLVVFQQEDMASIEAAVKAEGFNVEAVIKNEDGTIIYSQVEDIKDVTIVRLSDSMAVLMQNIDTQAAAMSEAANFNAEFPAEGFFQSEVVAKAALEATVSGLIQKGEVAGIAAVTEQFTAYVAALTAAVPEAVFKADAAVAKMAPMGKMADPAKAKSKMPEGSNAEEQSETPDEEKKEQAAGGVDTPGVDGKPGTGKDVQPQTDSAQSAADQAKALAMSRAKKDEEFETTLKSLTDSIAALSTQVTAFVETQKSFKEELDLVARKSDDASKQLQSTVLGMAKADPETKVKEVQKSENDPRTGLFDSAMFARRPR